MSLPWMDYSTWVWCCSWSRSSRSWTDGVEGSGWARAVCWPWWFPGAWGQQRRRRWETEGHPSASAGSVSSGRPSESWECRRWCLPWVWWSAEDRCGQLYTHSAIIIIIIISHLLHENKSEVLTIEIEMADMQMEQARSYKLIQGLVPRAG